MKLLFLIRSLERGGAERQLIELVKELANGGHQITVCTFYAGGALRIELEGLERVELVCADKRGPSHTFGFLYRLARIARSKRPDVTHGYMGIANELALLMAWLSGSSCIWGLRASMLDFAKYDVTSRIAFRVGALSSGLADAIIVNSHAGKRDYEAHGFSAKRMFVIPNGIDCDRFRPNLSVRESTRREWSIEPHQQLVGIVGRLDPMKDHITFLRAAANVASSQPAARFVCIGEGTPSRERELMRLSRDLGLETRLTWAGPRDDMAAVYNALDLLVSSSAFGEGFPNVVAEAMATGTRCVVTRVGDAARIVGELCRSVSPGDPSGLATAILTSLNLDAAEHARVAAACRLRIIENFSKPKLAEATVDVIRFVQRAP